MEYCKKCGKLGFLAYHDSLCFTCNEEFYNFFCREYSLIEEPISCGKCGRLGYVFNYNTFCWKCTDVYTIKNRVYIGPYRLNRQTEEKKESVFQVKTSNRYSFLDEN